MAQLQGVIITGSGVLQLGKTENTSSAGNMWFDTTAKNIKVSRCVIGWTIGGTMSVSQYKLTATGIQNAALAIGGRSSSPIFTNGCTEEYDGTSWSAGGALSCARYGAASAGTQNSGLVFGGKPIPQATTCVTEEYDGSIWTSGGNLNSARCFHAGIGIQNSALAAAGRLLATVSNCTEEYDGSTWATGNAVITTRECLAGAGTQNSGIIFGGRNSVCTFTCTEKYNGTSWSSDQNLIVPASNIGASGTQNDVLIFGGSQFSSPGALKISQQYDGTSWKIGYPLIKSRQCGAGAGSSANSALALGGYYYPKYFPQVEESSCAIFSTDLYSDNFKYLI